MALMVQTLAVGPLQTNCYLVGCAETKEAIVIDPAGNAPRIREAIREGGFSVRLIVNTHAHFDHVGANGAIREATGAPIAIHRLDGDALAKPAQFMGLSLGGPASPPADRLLEDGEEIAVGRETLQVLHTPGHTPGGIALYHAPTPAVFSGDALFQLGIGRTDLPGGDYETLIESIRGRLLALPDGTTVYPGHGPATTIGTERTRNPYVAVR